MRVDTTSQVEIWREILLKEERLQYEFKRNLVLRPEALGVPVHTAVPPNKPPEKNPKLKTHPKSRYNEYNKLLHEIAELHPLASKLRSIPNTPGSSVWTDASSVWSSVGSDVSSCHTCRPHYKPNHTPAAAGAMDPMAKGGKLAPLSLSPRGKKSKRRSSEAGGVSRHSIAGAIATPRKLAPLNRPTESAPAVTAATNANPTAPDATDKAASTPRKSQKQSPPQQTPPQQAKAGAATGSKTPPDGISPLKKRKARRARLSSSEIDALVSKCVSENPKHLNDTLLMATHSKSRRGTIPLKVSKDNVQTVLKRIWPKHHLSYGGDPESFASWYEKQSFGPDGSGIPLDAFFRFLSSKAGHSYSL
eukprot:GFYU01017561.1.p1 GENE.GFYU01017561.1~~GFYU01017561.1.p1  ORF type:complete len:362 (-),score=85.15 GFYU01017561.1:160-1245(-)